MLALRAAARWRWRSWVLVAVIVGLVSGTVMAAVMGARRTSSAYERFRSSQSLLAALLVLMAMASLAHAVVLSVRPGATTSPCGVRSGCAGASAIR